MVLPDISNKIFKAIQEGENQININIDELKHTTRQALCAKGGEDNPGIKSFQKMCKRTPTMRRCTHVMSAAADDSKVVLEKMFKKGQNSLMSDFIETATNENAFSTDDSVLSSDPLMGLVGKAMKFVSQNPGYDQRTLDQAFIKMEKSIKELDLNKDFTTIIKEINLLIMKFMKIQNDCIKRSKNILPKVAKGKSTTYTRDVLENFDILAQVVDRKQGLPNGVKSSLQLKVAKEYQKVNNDYSYMQLVAFGQRLDKVLEQAMNARGKQKEDLQVPPSRGTGTDKTWITTQGRGGGRGGRRTRYDGSHKSSDSACNMGSDSPNDVDTNEMFECFNNGTAQQGHDEPPRWFMLLPSMRRAGMKIDKDKLREQDKKNARKHKCEDRWREEDRKYYEHLQRGQRGENDRGAAAEQITASAQLLSLIHI